MYPENPVAKTFTASQTDVSHARIEIIMKEQILYIDMDNVLVDFTSAFGHLDSRVLETYAGRLDEVPGIFSKMAPLSGAVEAFHTLAQQYDTYILSTAPWRNPSAWQDKLLWVQKHLGEPAHKRLILTHHKNLHHGDYLIDDRTANGAGEFRGTHLHFGTERFPDWQSILGYLCPSS